MRHLSIDIETYSSVPIEKAGAYKYAQSDDFQILLFAYSADGAPVQIVDLAQGERLPDDIRAALTDPMCIKHAYNAAFEWICLSRIFGPLPIEQWRCTMLQGLYCGYPGNLAAIGAALKLPEDKKKLAAGKSLIRYFCVPCKPTRTNGARLRNLPRHAPEKWALFKEYCKGDVVTETAVQKRFANFPVPDMIQKQWESDAQMNARGVPVDMDLVHGALVIGANERNKLVDEAVRLSGVRNPNSTVQLLDWLSNDAGAQLPDLRKDTVSKALDGDLHDKARRILEIRKELAKTSTKKYDAIANAVCADGRVRGLLQFYGGNRTGRWAGRLVQVQNLPRTYLYALDLARTIVKRKKADALRLLYGSVPDTLSQLIRTAFTASEGRVLLDADFSAIEARVISWLAKEQWRIDVFNTHGKIYEASASQMFGVPIERIAKGNPEYALRQKGKVAELALGYNGGVGALKQMGALEMGLKEEELPEIVTRWREANKRIRDLWYAIDAAALQVVKTSVSAGVNGLVFAREVDIGNGLDFMTVRLPSGRKLYYAQPKLGINRFGSESVVFTGVDQTTRKWTQIETYGGKLTENVIQAIARDCLAEALSRLQNIGCEILFHVHDEVVIDCPKDQADLALVSRVMSEPIPWAQGLPLAADGWIGEYYRKD